MPPGGAKRAVLIAGPTASGKSALALRLAAEYGGIVVNADAMQVYDALRVLTARPSPEDEEAAEHRLYGFIDPGRRFSTGAWLRAVGEMLADPDLSERPLIFVGGTGMYFDALLGGLAEVPAVPHCVVAGIDHEIRLLDEAGRRRLLEQRDPAMAERLMVPDPQRLVRALSVLVHTGRSLATYQDSAQESLIRSFSVERLLVDPGREVVRQRIADRFASMLDGGAIEEVRALLSCPLEPSLPAMKAIGVREIGAILRGEISREEAAARAITATHQYAKRQRTWFRNRFSDWLPVDH